MPLHTKNVRLISDLRTRWYFGEFERAFAAQVNQVGLPAALDYLTEVMRAAQPAVELLLDARVRLGEIRDKSQSRKSVAGNGFQGLVAYALAHCQEHDLLDSRLVFVLKPKEHELITTYA